MDCIECKSTSAEGASYCSKCGAELGHSLGETLRRKGVRDRQALEVEITESVVGRLMKWAGWLSKIVAVIIALLAILLGKSYLDLRAEVREGKAQISAIKGVRLKVEQNQ